MLHVHQRGKSERQQPRDVSRNEEMLRKSRSKIGNSYSVDVNQLPKNVLTKARQLFGSEICQHYLQERGFKRNLKVDKESVCLWEEENGNLFSEKYQPVSLSCKEKSEESGVVDLPDHQQTQKHSPPLSEDVTLVVPSETGQDSLLAARGLDILVDESSSETKSLYNALETELWSPKLAKIFSPEAGVEQSRYQIEGIRSNNLQTSHNITSVDVSEHWNTSSHCDNSQNPDNITTSNVDVSKHWNTSSHCDNSQNPDNITTSNIDVSEHWNTSSHCDNSQNPDNMRTSNVDVSEHWNTSSHCDNSQNPDNITTSNVDDSEHWNTSSHCDNSQNPDNITTSNVNVSKHWNTSSHCENSQNPDNITTSNVDVSEHWNTSSRGDNSQNPDNITSNVDVSEHWNTSSHGDTSQNPDNKTSNVDVSEHWDKSSDTQEDVNVVALSSCFKSVVKDDIHCKETCHDDPPLDHSFNTTDSFRFISLTETERVGQSNNSSKEDQVETFKHRDGASSSDEFKTSSFEERIPLSTGSTSNEEGKQTSEHQVCSDVISLENKMSTITQDVSRKQTQDNEENDDENKEDDNESLNTLKLEEDNCKVTEDVLQNNIVKSLDSGIRKRKCSKRQVNNVNNMSENQDIQCEIPIKNRKVSALSVYASIENGMITEVKCKRFKKRTVKNREKCDISGTSDCRTAGEEREGNIAKNKNSCLVVSPKPTNYSCDPAIREVVEDLVQTVFLNSLDRENDLKLEDPNNVRVKDLFQKFCDDFNFEHCDYQELITDFSETVKPKLSGCGEYSVPPTKRGRKKFDQNINSSAPDVPQHLYHRGESKTMNKFYHSISLRRKSRWLRQIPSAKRVVTRLALHEMGLEKVEDLESIHEGKKRKSSGGVVEDASRASATFVKFNGGVVEDASRPSATFVKFNGGVVEDASRASATFAKFNGLRKDKTASSQKKQSLKRKRRIMNQSGNDGSCFTSCQVHEECVKEGGHDSVRLTSVQNGYKVNYKNLKRTNLEDGVRIVGKPQDTLVPRNYGFRERSHRDLKENEQNAGTDSLGKKTKKFSQAGPSEEDDLNKAPSGVEPIDQQPIKALVTPRQSSRDETLARDSRSSSVNTMGEEHCEKADLQRRNEPLQLSSFISSMPIASLPLKYRRLHSFEKTPEEITVSSNLHEDSPVDLSLTTGNELETASTNRPATLVQRVRPQIHRSSECPVRQPPKRAFQIQNSQKLSELEQNVSSDVCLETEGLFIKQEPTAATISPQEHLKSGMIQDVAKEESILRTLLLEDDVNEYCDKSVLESGHNEFEDDLHQIDKKSSLIVHSVEKLLPEKIEQCLLEEKETPIILEENPIFVDNKDWMDFSIWANDPHALKNKIEKLRREILYLDMMAAQKEKERLLILHFRKYKKEVMKKIFRERILPSQRMELNVQTRQKSEKKPISTSSTSSAVKYCPKQYDSKSAKDISRKETCLVRPMLHVESNNDVLQRDSSVECAIVKTSRNFIRDPTEEHLSTRLTRNSNGHTKVEGLSSTAGSSQPICSSRRGPSFNLESFSYSNLSTGHVPHLSSNSSSFTSVAHSKNEIMSFSPLSSISRVTPVSDFNKAIVTDVTTPKNSTSYTGAAPQRSQMTGLSHVSKQEYMPHFSCSTVPLIAPPIYHSVHRIPPPTYNPLPLTVNSPSWIPVEFPWLGVKPPIDYQTNNRRLKEAVESREDGKKRCAGGQKSPRHVAPELNHFSMDNAVYRDDQLI